MNSYVARDVLTVARVTEDGQSFEDLGIMERKAGQLIIKCQSYEQLSPSHEALCARIDELCAEVEAEKQRNAKLFKAAEKWMAKAAHYEAENAKLRADQAHWELGNCPSCPNVVSLQEALEQNAKLRELVSDMWQLINDLDATPYVTERHGNNPAVTWLDDDWSVHESCRERMRELGIEVTA